LEGKSFWKVPAGTGTQIGGGSRRCWLGSLPLSGVSVSSIAVEYHCRGVPLVGDRERTNLPAEVAPSWWTRKEKTRIAAPVSGFPSHEVLQDAPYA